jgi:hypothetical protein
VFSFLTLFAAAPVVDPSVITAAETFSKWPVTIAFGLLLLTCIAFVYWYVTKAWPAQQESNERRIATAIEQGEQTRRFLDEMLQKRGVEAAASEKLIVDGIAGEVKEIADAVDKTARSVDDVHGKVSDVHKRVSDVHEKVDTMHGLVRLLAQKGGVGILLLLAFMGGAATLHLGRRAYAAWQPPVITPTLSADCSAIGGCKAPEYCCQKDICCRNANVSACACSKAADTETTSTALHDMKPQGYVVQLDYGSDPFAAWNARQRQL